MIDPYFLDWVGLLFRWFHFMMGVAWIGASFYFVWLNNTVRPLESGGKPGVAGELWAVHGGAFYQVAKYAGAPEKLPKTLHWFKWEAYLTWLSGFSLLALFWWANPRTTMIDPQVMALEPWQAATIGATTLFGGWLVYDGLCRSPLKNHGTALAGILFAFIVATAYGLSEVLSARAAYLHVGAMLGTWMAANVWRVIIPGQAAMVDAMIKGEPPPIERGQAGALRSLHNNYLTLPVLFVMISGHFPATWGHPRGWAILAVLGLIGAGYRHHVNLEERGQAKHWILPALGAAFVGLALLVRPTPAAPKGDQPHISMARVQQIVAKHCLACHSSEPIQPGIAVAPKGVKLETPEEIRREAAKIRQQVVVAKIMPLGNLTGMTDEERELIGQWADQQ